MVIQKKILADMLSITYNLHLELSNLVNLSVAIKRLWAFLLPSLTLNGSINLFCVMNGRKNRV